MNLFHRPQQRRQIFRDARVHSGVSNAGDPARVAVLETHGSYAGRPVKFFRAVDIQDSGALLGSGHVEPNGTIVSNLRQSSEGPTPARFLTDRARHADDERLVFWDATSAKVSEAALFAPPATWLRAREKERTPQASVAQPPLDQPR